MGTSELNKRQPALAAVVIDCFYTVVVGTGRFTIRPRSDPQQKEKTITLEGVSKPQTVSQKPLEVPLLPARCPVIEEKITEPKEKILTAAQLEMLEAIEAREKSMAQAEEKHIKREAVMASSLRRDEYTRSTLSEFTAAYRMDTYRRH